jgi:hypothetical protein
MRLRHRGKRPVRREELAPPDPGFTPYQCIQIYWLNEQGVSQRALAQNLDCSKTTIFRAIRRGRDSFCMWDAPRILLVVGSDTVCGHNRPIRVGERVVCLKCFVSGYDQVDDMQVTAADLARIEREAFEATLPKDEDGKPVYPQEPMDLNSYAERKFGGRGKQKKKRLTEEAR